MTKSNTRDARHARVRQKITGVTGRPRLSVFRSLNHIYAQVIDDTIGTTLVAASSLDAEIKNASKDETKSALASKVGALLASRAKEKGITEVAFDRGGFKYHGRVKALAEAAREGGLKF